MKRLFDFGLDLMERFRNSKRRKVAELNYFDRLPDELVVQIFEKVSEAKWLFMCYMVSPRFASLVVQCRTVSFKYLVPLNEKRLLDLSSMVEKFLMKFVSIQSLHVEVIYCGGLQHAREDVFKWKAIGYQKSFILLVINRRRDITSADNDDKPNVGATIQINPLREERLYNRLKKLESKIGNFIGRRYVVLAKIIKIWGFPNLKEVVVTDSLNRGRLFIGENTDIDMMRMSDPMTITATVSKLWSQPVLKLPLSGFVAEEATLAIFKSSIDIDDVSIAQHAFQEEEEKELCEAAMELLKLKPIYDSQYTHDSLLR